MTLTVEATYENGCLKLSQPLPLPERQRVRITVDPVAGWSPGSGVIPCTEPELIERVAMDPELDFPPPKEAP